MTAPTDTSKAKPVGRCVYCAARVMDRDGVQFCDKPAVPCRRGPVVYTGVDQLTELGLLPCPHAAEALLIRRVTR